MIENNFFPWKSEENEPARILDLCSGSGCIGIALAYKYPNSEIELLDVSFDALEVASENISNHHLDDRVVVFQSNLFDAADGQYDLIISNPPYVDAEDMACLPNEYKKEPEMALAAGNDGLELVHIIIKKAAQYLTEYGLLVIEVGNSWPALEAAYPDVSFTWQKFEKGGHGVCVFNATQLKRYFG
jgi:ribosomal protein L3 glutamine methyltransferase